MKQFWTALFVVIALFCFASLPAIAQDRASSCEFSLNGVEYGIKDTVIKYNDARDVIVGFVLDMPGQRIAYTRWIILTDFDFFNPVLDQNIFVNNKIQYYGTEVSKDAYIASGLMDKSNDYDIEVQYATYDLGDKQYVIFIDMDAALAKCTGFSLYNMDLEIELSDTHFVIYYEIANGVPLIFDHTGRAIDPRTEKPAATVKPTAPPVTPTPAPAPVSKSSGLRSAGDFSLELMKAEVPNLKSVSITGNPYEKTSVRFSDNSNEKCEAALAYLRSFDFTESVEGGAYEKIYLFESPYCSVRFKWEDEITSSGYGLSARYSHSYSAYVTHTVKARAIPNAVMTGENRAVEGFDGGQALTAAGRDDYVLTRQSKQYIGMFYTLKNVDPQVVQAVLDQIGRYAFTVKQYNDSHETSWKYMFDSETVYIELNYSGLGGNVALSVKDKIASGQMNTGDGGGSASASSGTASGANSDKSNAKKCSKCHGNGKCSECKGSGECWLCNGKGYHLTKEGDKVGCRICVSGKCSDCGGYGKCGQCGGSGVK